MGKIELHDRVFGGGLVGDVQIETGLSWFQERTLDGIRDATRETTRPSGQLLVRERA
jgi:hypothetical protein